MPSLARPFFFVLLLLTSSFKAWAADGRIIAFEGDVRVNGTPVTDETELHSNDLIATATNASIKIILSDNSLLDLDSDTEISLSDYSFRASEPGSNTSDISVVEGTLRYVSGLIAKEDPDNIRFTAGNSTIGVRGSFTEIEVAGVVVNVEAMIGEATITVEDIDCAERGYIVATGQAAQTDPITCDTILGPAVQDNEINNIVHAIAAADPNDTEAQAAIASMLADLSVSDLALVVVVLNNNAKHLGIGSDSVNNTVRIISTVNPEASDTVQRVVVVLIPPSDEPQTELPLPIDTGNPPNQHTPAAGGAPTPPPSPE